MFGFLPSPCSTCHQAEHSIYRQYFCGLSGALARDYGPSARFFTNRDGTFFSLLAAAQQEQTPCASLTTCCNPFGKKRELCDRGAHAEYAAAVSVCAVSTKLQDDAEDEHGIRKHLSAFGHSLLKRNVIKAKRTLNASGFPTAQIEAEMDRQEQIETSFNGDWKIAAGPSAMAYGSIFAHTGRLNSASERNNQFQKLTGTGSSLGRIIYLLDAFEDREEDAQKSRFNPVIKTKDGQIKHWFEEQYEQLQNHFSGVVKQHHTSLLNSILIEGVYAKSAQILGMSSGAALNKKKRRSCWDHCDCSSGCDCSDCCDCGPSSSSSCDCDCCPCDGC